MNPNEMLKELQKRFPSSEIVFSKDEFGLVHVIPPNALYLEAAKFLKEDPAFDMDLLECLTAVDYIENITVVSHLYSFTHRHWIVLKCMVTKEAPLLPTLSHIWPAANWFEREVYDLFGIVFTGHPDLRRIMLPDDWVGHPLRKDYKDENIIKRPAMAREPV